MVNDSYYPNNLTKCQNNTIFQNKGARGLETDTKLFRKDLVTEKISNNNKVRNSNSLELKNWIMANKKLVFVDKN